MSFAIVSANYDLKQKRAVIKLQNENADASTITIETSLRVTPETSEHNLRLLVEQTALEALLNATSYLGATCDIALKLDEATARNVKELRHLEHATRSSLLASFSQSDAA